MQPEYEVEAIVGKKLIDGDICYLVKWLKYSSDENTWEPEANLAACKELVAQYEKSLEPEEQEDLKFVLPAGQICKLLRCYECGCVLDYNGRSHQCGVSRCGVCIEDEPLQCSCSDEESKDSDWTPLAKEVRNQIDALEVYCPNRRYGCNKTRPMGQLQQHLDNGCAFTAICDKCGEFVSSKQLQQHKRDACSMREVECPWCKEKGLAKEMDEHERDLKLCVKRFANMLEHPLVKQNNKRKQPQRTEEFIVDDDYTETESKREIDKQYQQWKAKKGRTQ